MAKGYIIFDLGAGHGTARFLSGVSLARNDKSRLEVDLANMALDALSSAEETKVENIRSNPSDPPDVLFELNEKEIGIELSELLPENRLWKDAVLQRLREDILRRIPQDHKTKDCVVTIMLKDDYASQIQIQGCAPRLASVLTACFEEPSPRPNGITVPAELQSYVSLITFTTCDLSADPRIKNEMEPLIVFSAQHANIVPARDFPEMVDKIVRKKELHDLSSPTWLLLWSSHYSLGPLTEQLVEQIDEYFLANPTNYDRVFYLRAEEPHSLNEFYRE